MTVDDGCSAGKVNVIVNLYSWTQKTGEWKTRHRETRE